MIDRVEEIFKNCLFKDEKSIKNPKIVEGITITVGFDPKRIEENKKEINSLLDNIHENFKNGWSFLNLCIDKNENMWTGNHATMEKLLLLGLAIDRIEYCCNRDMWSMLPEGLPYIFIK